MRWIGVGALAVLSACGSGGSGGASSHAGDPSALLFAEDSFHNLDLTLDPGDWDSILEDSRGNEWRSADLRWNGIVLTDIGVRPTGGNRYAGNPKMSLHLRFDAFVPGQTFLGLGELKLDGLSTDPSMIRDRISYAAFHAMGPAPRATHVKLWVNEAYRGVYMLEELYERTFVLRTFGIEGWLYRVDVSIDQQDHDPYAWLGDDESEYVPEFWEPKVEPAGVAPRVVEYIRLLNEELPRFPEICDMEGLLGYFAVEALITDTHGFAGDLMANNHFQYHDPVTGRFRILPWDVDASWGNNDGVPDRDLFENFQRSRLSAAVENTPAWRDRYVERVGEALRAVPLEKVHAQVDAVYDLIRQAVYDDPYKPWTDSHFDWSQGYIKTFATERYAFLESKTGP